MNSKIPWWTIINLLFLIAIPLITEKLGMSSDVKNAIYNMRFHSYIHRYIYIEEKR